MTVAMARVKVMAIAWTSVTARVMTRGTAIVMVNVIVMFRVSVWLG
jgi:hypothetical protein